MSKIRLAVGTKEGQKQLVEAVVDTGYTGFLSLPSVTINELGLVWKGIDRATLGDGSEATFEVYKAT